MEGSNHWQLTVRRTATDVTILRATTCDRSAALPDTLWNLPVTALDDHALAPNAGNVDGESVTITCGPASDEWNNQNLRTLSLPASLHTLGNYALFNCTALETLHLSGIIRHCGSGILTNCRSLGTLQLSGSAVENLSWLVGELSRELDISFPTEHGPARLIFPAYHEDYEENCPAHHFDYAIHGGGYPYRLCFRDRRIRFPDYDALWLHYLEAAPEDSSPIRLAYCRLRWPVELSDTAADHYRSYLTVRGTAVIDWLINQRDMSGLAFLLRTLSLPPDVLSEGCETARQCSASEALALLLEARRPFRPRAAERTFDL